MYISIYCMRDLLADVTCTLLISKHTQLGPYCSCFFLIKGRTLATKAHSAPMTREGSGSRFIVFHT